MATTTKGVLAVWMIAVSVLSAQQDPMPHFAVPTVLKAEPVSDWNAKFAGKEGWIGGDGVYSLALDRQRVLWFFGDTLLGAVKEGKRVGAVMVNNTVGVQTGQGKDIVIRFCAGEGRDKKPTSIFLPPDGKGWFWPQAAAPVGDRVAVFLAQIDKSQESGVFGFRQLAQWLAVIENAADEPLHWRMKYHKIPFAQFTPTRAQSWGSAALADGKHLYIYGFQEQGKMKRRKLLAARAPADNWTDFASWRFRTVDGWSANAAEAAPLASGLATEFSVSRLPDEKGYALVYTENGLSDRIMARWASTPAGSWSDPVLLYRCPEMAKDKGVFCYSAKAHPWAVKNNELLVSYCVNTWEFARLFAEEKVYRPQFVRIKLRPSK
ncbi:MAG TPA: DUF4185 domain-containing protein [Gemmataceae bacterium]|nr:DUF4185 domain-containing protein [Gemmataceae bacterium]